MCRLSVAHSWYVEVAGDSEGLYTRQGFSPTGLLVPTWTAGLGRKTELAAYPRGPIRRVVVVDGRIGRVAKTNGRRGRGLHEHRTQHG